MRSVVILTLALAFAISKDGPTKKKDDLIKEGVKQVKIYGRGLWHGVDREAQQLVIKNAEELAKAAGAKDATDKEEQKKAVATVAKAVGVDSIDFDKQMLIVVSAGIKKSGGFRMEITQIELNDKTMTVTWKLNAPKGIRTGAITHPAMTAVVDQFDGKVVFKIAEK